MQSLNYLGSAFTFSALIYHFRYLHFLETFDCYPSLLSCNDNDVYKPMIKTFLYLSTATYKATSHDNIEVIFKQCNERDTCIS